MKAEEYKQKLREEGINPEVDGISKYISQQQSGEPVNFSNMIRTIEVHKTDSITNPVQPKVRGLEEDGKNVNNKMMVPYKDKYMNFTTKRQIDSKNNYYKSQKEVFDWDLHTEEKIRKEEEEPEAPIEPNRETTIKNLYLRDVFTQPENVERKPEVARSYHLGSDIFHKNEQGGAKKKPIRQSHNEENEIFKHKPESEQNNAPTEVKKKTIRQNGNKGSNIFNLDEEKNEEKPRRGKRVNEYHLDSDIFLQKEQQNEGKKKAIKNDHNQGHDIFLQKPVEEAPKKKSIKKNANSETPIDTRFHGKGRGACPQTNLSEDNPFAHL